MTVAGPESLRASTPSPLPFGAMPGQQPSHATHTNPPESDAPRPQAATLAELLGRTVLLVTGKGGVGKSTVTASLARRAAASGKRVLLVELESVSRVAPLFGLRKVGPEPTRAAPNLDVMGLDSMDSLRFFALQQLKVATLVNLAMRNKAVESFFQAVPAIKPMLFLYHLWRLETEHGPTGDRRWDLIVCDLPTTGFAVGMYAIPKTLAQVFRLGPIANYAEGMRQLLADPRRSGVVLVALPEDMPVVETLELHASLRSRFGVEAAAIVLNGVFPELLQPAEADAVAKALNLRGADTDPAHGDEAPVRDAWLWAARLLVGRRHRALGHLPKLRAAVAGRVLELPFLFQRELPLEAVDRLARALDSTLPAPGEVPA